MSAEPIAACRGWSATALARRWDLAAVHLFRRVGSTNDVARQLAERGAPSGTAVIAEEQIAGRGRTGRVWASPPGLGVWLSVVVRPAELPNPALLPLAVGLAAARTLDPFTGPDVAMLKWPNDLVVGGQKLGGILCEAVWSGAAPAFVVIGIGINAQHSEVDFPAELRPSATSLRLVSGREQSLPDLAGALARAVVAAGQHPPARLDSKHAADLPARDALRGREVTLDGIPCGTALGIAADGALLVRTPDGGTRLVRTGTVRPVKITA